MAENCIPLTTELSAASTKNWLCDTLNREPDQTGPKFCSLETAHRNGAVIFQATIEKEERQKFLSVNIKV